MTEETITLHDVEPIDFEKEMEKLPLRAVYSRVLVKEYVVKKTAGGLWIPEVEGQNSMQTNAGVILSVGEEVKSQMMKPGVVVYYGRFSGAWLTVNGEKYRVMNYPDIMGVIPSGVVKR